VRDARVRECAAFSTAVLLLVPLEGAGSPVSVEAGFSKFEGPREGAGDCFFALAGTL
jgi:hypothetical protein